MQNATIAESVFGPSVSKNVTGADSTGTKLEESTVDRSPIAPSDQSEAALQASLIEPLVGPKLGRALTAVEIHSTRLACKAADKTLTAVGNMLVRIGVTCLDAGERVAAFGMVCTPGAQVGFSEEALKAWPELGRAAMESKMSAKDRAYNLALAKIRFDRDQKRRQAFEVLNRSSL